MNSNGVSASLRFRQNIVRYLIDQQLSGTTVVNTVVNVVIDFVFDLLRC